VATSAEYSSAGAVHTIGRSPDLLGDPGRLASITRRRTVRCINAGRKSEQI